jgi:hypothetical protein
MRAFRGPRHRATLPRPRFGATTASFRYLSGVRNLPEELRRGTTASTSYVQQSQAQDGTTHRTTPRRSGIPDSVSTPTGIRLYVPLRRKRRGQPEQSIYQPHRSHYRGQTTIPTLSGYTRKAIRKSNPRLRHHSSYNPVRVTDLQTKNPQSTPHSGTCWNLTRTNNRRHFAFSQRFCSIGMLTYRRRSWTVRANHAQWLIHWK